LGKANNNCEPLIKMCYEDNCKVLLEVATLYALSYKFTLTCNECDRI